MGSGLRTLTTVLGAQNLRGYKSALDVDDAMTNNPAFRELDPL